MPVISGNTSIRYSAYFIASLLFTLLCSDNSFFWDSVRQVSIPAGFYFDNDFSALFMSSGEETGHQPFMGMYIALIWKFFGKSLLVSHLAMLPFVFGILIQLDKLVLRGRPGKTDFILIILITVCDATLLSQMSMITFDIPHIFFFLWCVNSILGGNRKILAFAFTFLMLISLRGTLSGIGILLFVITRILISDNRVTLKNMLPFFPGLVSFFIFVALFLHSNGWVVFNPGSPDYNTFGSLAAPGEIFRNIGLTGWRLIDFGRAGIWMIFLFIIIKSIRRKTLFDAFYSDLFLVAVCQFAVFFFIVILFRNPFGHRYFLPVIIPVSIAVTYWVLKYSRLKYRLYTLMLVIVLSGYFWIYPAGIASGWDATPAHWPYFKVQKEMNENIVAAGIDYSKIGSFFPVKGSTRFIDLEEPGVNIHEADLVSDDYILYSNVCNVGDTYLDELFDGTKWQRLIEVRHKRVFMILFKRKHA